MLRHYINMSCQDDDPDAGARQLLGGKPGPKLPPKPRAGGGTSPLHLASCRGHVGVVHELLSAGADASRGDQFGYSALHLAAKHGFPDVITEMLSFSAVDVNLLDESGETALHTAARYSKTMCLSRLLDHGGDFGIRSRSGRKPLDVVGQPQDKHGRQSMPHSATQLAGTGGCRRSHKFNTNLPPPQLPRDRCTEERIRRLLRAAATIASSGGDGWMWPAAGGGVGDADAVVREEEEDRGGRDVAEPAEESAADCAAGANNWKPRETTAETVPVASTADLQPAAVQAACGVAAVEEGPFLPVMAWRAASPERGGREENGPNGEARPPQDETVSAAVVVDPAIPESTHSKGTVAEKNHWDTPALPVAVAAVAVSGGDVHGDGHGALAGADAAGGGMKHPASTRCGTRTHSGSTCSDNGTSLCTRGASALDGSGGKGRAANGCVCMREDREGGRGSDGGGAVGGGGAPGAFKPPLPLGRLNTRRLRKGRDGRGDVGVLKAINRYTSSASRSGAASRGR